MNTVANKGAVAGSTSCNNCPANYDTAGVTGRTACTGTLTVPTYRNVPTHLTTWPTPLFSPYVHALLACPAGYTSTGNGDACVGTSWQRNEVGARVANPVHIVRRWSIRSLPGGIREHLG